ncbi:MAG TPA: metal-binding protein [Pseudomonas xinjiangensis]|uniref:Large ribosomal RNA subunit accumulation protein YceD n=2 Tax=root TaxID=1 RepID=A0A7V1FSL1_9GAMM|nr:metal-binding protein [Halopseudomonas xinjiangensis]HEC46779.1 metal-binding protein [Halopseudomonas xinjiangensis]
MSGPIPAHIEPRRLVDRSIVLKGTVSADKMPRLSALLDAPAGDVQVELSFARDEQGVNAMHGHYQVDVALICQRCLEQVVVPLDSECDVGFVESDEAAKNLPRNYEPVILDDEKLDLHALIEDELLLALPAVPMHPLETCQHPPGYQPDPAELEEEVEKPNPFSVLAKLKRDT